MTASAEPDGTKGEGASIGSYSQPDPHASPKKTGMQGKRGQSRGPVYECADVPDNTYTDGKVADLAMKTLREIGKKEPFFLAVGFIRPHLPWVAPKKYWDLYDPANIGLATNQFLPLDAPFAVDPNDGEIRSYGGCPRRGPVPEDLQRKFKQAYFASLSYSDAQIGRVLDELRRLGLEKNTIVILWGDHGWKLGEHMAWGKHSNVENDVNAPLILSVPGMKNAGSHSRALLEFVDIYPTLCELAGIPLPGHLEGTSFKPLLDDPGRPWKAAAFSQWPRGRGKTGIGDLMGYTMRTDRYRFTIWVDRNDNSHVASIELYDHQRDPQENVNIAGKPEYSEIVKQLMEQCRSGWRASKPPLPSSPSARSGNRGSS